MEPAGLLLFSQEFAIGPYPEPRVSSQHHYTCFFKVHFNIILPSTHRSPMLSSSLEISG
jgi:hypothetical protein